MPMAARHKATRVQVSFWLDYRSKLALQNVINVTDESFHDESHGRKTFIL